MSTTDGPKSGSAAGVSGLLVLRFLTELALMAAAAVTGAALADGLALSIGAGIVAPLLVALLWGAFIAPRARWRLADPGRLVVEVILFVTSAAGLARAGYPVVAVAYGVVAVGTAIAVRRVAQGA